MNLDITEEERRCIHGLVAAGMLEDARLLRSITKERSPDLCTRLEADIERQRRILHRLNNLKGSQS